MNQSPPEERYGCHESLNYAILRYFPYFLSNPPLREPGCVLSPCSGKIITKQASKNTHLRHNSKEHVPPALLPNTHAETRSTHLGHTQPPAPPRSLLERTLLLQELRSRSITSNRVGVYESARKGGPGGESFSPPNVVFNMWGERISKIDLWDMKSSLHFYEMRKREIFHVWTTLG